MSRTNDGGLDVGRKPIREDASVANLTGDDPLCLCCGVAKLSVARPNRPLPPWQAIGACFSVRSVGQIQRPSSHIRADQSA
ncbi:hypothetical protein GA0070624_1553 [Micromonospora rhizosphaerae]|uniref:Uncharacterized protein n=1 Tax=Micromonospora rhizosphaerae TaxID=568872 RepID=A0A1C6RMZ8_9ACTN|nr:hypothetical protein GA0070624_1553 [Micromonospora rhizosphaerae]